MSLKSCLSSCSRPHRMTHSGCRALRVMQQPGKGQRYKTQGLSYQRLLGQPYSSECRTRLASGIAIHATGNSVCLRNTGK